jgi:hypothetical protein
MGSSLKSFKDKPQKDEPQEETKHMTEDESHGNQTLLDQVRGIIGEENLPKSSVSNLKMCLEILEELAEKRGLDYLKENRELRVC